MLQWDDCDEHLLSRHNARIDSVHLKYVIVSFHWLMILTLVSRSVWSDFAIEIVFFGHWQNATLSFGFYTSKLDVCTLYTVHIIVDISKVFHFEWPNNTAQTLLSYFSHKKWTVCYYYGPLKLVRHNFSVSVLYTSISIFSFKIYICRWMHCACMLF